MIKRRAVVLLSSLAATLAMAPASAHAASASPVTCSSACGAGGQLSAESSTTTQTAESQAAAQQSVANANPPVNLAETGSLGANASQRAEADASNNATSSAGNEAQTSQANRQGQGAAGSSCPRGCGAASQTQLSSQEATTTQTAESQARATQSAAVAAAPSIAANQDGGAERQASNDATSAATNSAGTKQHNSQSQDGAGGGCSPACGGSGQAQLSAQSSTTTQTAVSQAAAQQSLANAKPPVNLAEAPWLGASASQRAEADASNNATSSAGNEAQTSQGNGQSQAAAGSSCPRGCGAASQTQLSSQEATTTQMAESQAQAEQGATNPSQPANLAAGASITSNQDGGAERQASNDATSTANDSASTKQHNSQSQNGAGGGCSSACGGGAQLQLSAQSSTTTQRAVSQAAAQESLANANPLVNLAEAPWLGASASGRAEADASHSADEAQRSADPAAQANTTVQLIWQVQLPGCVARCSGTKQSQTAEQQNSIVQALNGAPQPAGARGAEVARDSARSERSVTQVQFGCLQYCFGTTAPTRAPVPASRVVEDFLRALALGVSLPSAARASEQNSVEQISSQWQRDPRGASLQTKNASQVQSASQTNTTVQEYDPSQLTVGLEQALAGSAAGGAGAVNQTEQGIWQLQIGCLAFCSETRQIQQAEQSNTTMHSAGTGRDSSSYPLTSSVNITTQTVWQVQVGCLMWCFDTEQQQTASSENLEGELPGQEAAEGVPPPTGAPPPAGASPPAGAPPTAGVPPTAGAPPTISSVPRGPCDHSPTPGECDSIVNLGGASPQGTGGTARRSSRPANRARLGGRIRTARSGAIAEANGGHTPTARALGAGAGASVAIYQLGAVRTSVTALGTVMGPGRSSSGHRQGSLVSRSLAAGMSAEAGSGSDAPVIALVAAIVLCTLAAARAFRSEPIQRRRATEK